MNILLVTYLYKVEESLTRAKNLLNEARDEFKGAIVINKDYSNARYFLGLVYDKQKEKLDRINALLDQVNQDLDTGKNKN